MHVHMRVRVFFFEFLSPNVVLTSCLESMTLRISGWFFFSSSNRHRHRPSTNSAYIDEHDIRKMLIVYQCLYYMKIDISILY